MNGPGRRAAPLLRLAAAALALLTAVSAAAFENDAPLPDPALEARAQALARELRCLVCQNQSLVESDAPLARDLRRLVRERLAAGDSDAEAKAFIAARYGDFVLLRPPFKPATWALWLGPPASIALALALLLRARRRKPRAPAPLDSEERARLDALLRRGGGA